MTLLLRWVDNKSSRTSNYFRTSNRRRILILDLVLVDFVKQDITLYSFTHNPVEIDEYRVDDPVAQLCLLTISPQLSPN